MKCENCGADITIEQAFCSSCGTKNKYYEAHRKDMASYEKRFEKTEEEVTTKAGILGKKTVFITVTAVLITLIIVEITAFINVSDIRYSIERTKNNKNANKIVRELNQYEGDRDYLEFARCYEKYCFNVDSKKIKEFDVAGNVCTALKGTVSVCSLLVSRDTEHLEAYSLASRLNNYLTTVYDCKKSASDRPDDVRYSGIHLETIDNVTEEIYAYLNVYLGIDFEVIKEFPQMKESERFKVLNESLEEVMQDEEQ